MQPQEDKLNSIKMPSNIANLLPTVSNFARNLFSLVRIRNAHTPGEVLTKGEKQTIRLRLIAVIVAVTVVYLGIDSNSPKYSFGTCIETISSNLINGNSTNFRLNQHAPACSPSTNYIAEDFISNAFLKVATLLTLTLLFFLRIDVFDKTKDEKKLQLLHSGKSKSNKFARALYLACHNDIKSYAETIPSRRVQNLCQSCNHKKGCKNSIRQNFDEKFSFPIWKRFYYNSNIDTDSLRHLVQATLKCRLIIYFNLIITDAILILGIAWIIHRAAEFVSNEGQYSFANTSTGAIIVGVLFLIFTNHHNKNNLSTVGQSVKGGVWSQYDFAGKALFSSQKNTQLLREIYKLEVCQQDDGQHTFTPINNNDQVDFSYEVLTDLHEHLNEMMLRKMAHLISDIPGNTPSSHIDNIVYTLQNFLKRNFTTSKDGVNFSCKFTKTLIESELNIQAKQKKHSLTIHMQTADGVCFNPHEIHPDFDYSGDQSILLTAIKLQPRQIEEIEGIIGTHKIVGRISTKPVGYLQISSEDNSLFNSANLSEFLSIIDSFSIRIVLEAIAMNKKEKQS